MLRKSLRCLAIWVMERKNVKTKRNIRHLSSFMFIYHHLSTFIIIYHHLSIIHHPMPLLTACLTALLIPPIDSSPLTCCDLSNGLSVSKGFYNRVSFLVEKKQIRCEISPMHVYNCIYSIHVCVCTIYAFRRSYLSSGWEELGRMGSIVAMLPESQQP